VQEKVFYQVLKSGDIIILIREFFKNYYQEVFIQQAVQKKMVVI